MGNNINWGSIYKKTNFGKGVTNATNGWGSIYANLVSSISGILSSLKSVGTYYENEEATEETLNSLEKCKILEKATILITPTSYSDGILHAAKPTNGLGVEEVVNGDFATDSDWNKGSGWGISGGSANCSGAQSSFSELKQFSNLVVGNTYRLKANISVTQGNVEIKGNAGYSTAINSSTFVDIIIVANLSSLRFLAYSNFIGSIDNVSVKEVISADLDLVRGSAATRTNANGNVDSIDKLGVEEIVNGDFATDSDWDKGTGWSISNGYASCNGEDSSAIKQEVSDLTIGKTYKIIFNILNYTSGSIKAYLPFGQPNLGDFSSNGTYTLVTTISSSSQKEIYFRSNLFIGSIDNVSVKEVIDVTNIPRIDYTGGVGHILLEGQATQLYENTETLGTQDNTTTAQDYSVSFYGTGTVTLSGAYTGTLAGIGVNERVSLKFTSTAATLTSTVSGTVTKGQLEVGDVSSYIPNTTGTATRLAETLSRGGLSGLINSEAGVLYVNFSALNDDLSQRYITLNDGSDSNYIVIRFYNISNKISAFLYNSEGVQGSTSYVVDDIKTFNEVAFYWKLNEFRLFVNGFQRGSTILTGSVFGNNKLNKISFDNGVGGRDFFGKLTTLAVFPELTDTELQCLTTQS